MAMLIEQRGHDVQITEGVVRATARNRGKDIMALLLEKRGHDVQITEGVVLTAE